MVQPTTIVFLSWMAEKSQNSTQSSTFLITRVRYSDLSVTKLVYQDKISSVYDKSRGKLTSLVVQVRGELVVLHTYNDPLFTYEHRSITCY